MGGDRQPRRSLFGRSLLQPQRRTICRAPLLGFKCEPCPGACNVEQNVLHSHVGCTLGHLTAFSGAISASFRCKHNAPRGSIASKCPKAKPRRGGPAGLKLGRICGSGGAYLPSQPFKSASRLIVPKNFDRVCCRFCARDASLGGQRREAPASSARASSPAPNK